MTSAKTTTTGEALLAYLADAGVDQVFGIPGNHTVALYRGFDAAGIRHITCRHEQGAAFMADGYARVSGTPGVCVLISGPGLLNAATAIAQASADSVPMLVITGVAATGDLGMARGTLHELPDQRATAASFCRESHTLLDPENLPDLLNRAFACFSSSRPGPVHLEIPLDLMDAPLSVETIRFFNCSSPGPDPRAIGRAAELMSSAEQPIILVGGGARRAASELTALAETLDAPVLNTVNGKGICPWGHPLAVGGSPSLPCLNQALNDADRVLAIGTELSETDYDLLMADGIPDTAGWIRVDIDPAQLLIPSPPELAITSDSRLACAALLEAATELPESPAAAESGAERATRLRNAVARETHYHSEMKAFLDTVGAVAEDLTLVGDSTRPTYYAAWQYECQRPNRYFHSVSGFGTLGYALPAALGAAAAGQGPVIALLGDGGAQFTLPELTTGAQAGLSVPVIIWNNHGYAEIENSMTARQVPAESTHILTPDFRQAAAAHRCAYELATDLDELGRALRKALSAGVPTLIEVNESDFLTTPSGGWYQ
jgi:acetolactate synthase-1/2/3 large subunit